MYYYAGIPLGRNDKVRSCFLSHAPLQSGRDSRDKYYIELLLFPFKCFRNRNIVQNIFPVSVHGTKGLCPPARCCSVTGVSNIPFSVTSILILYFTKNLSKSGFGNLNSARIADRSESVFDLRRLSLKIDRFFRAYSLFQLPRDG